MQSTSTKYHATLFYSYSHKDSQHREAIEKSLSLLKQNGFLSDWSDQKILPGKSITDAVQRKIDEADIVVFLISQNFIASAECMKEWERVKDRADQNQGLFRIPVILEDCAWIDLLGTDKIKALPNDGKPVSSFSKHSTAWQQVYEGIKSVTTELRNTFAPKTDFIATMEQTDFLSKHSIRLQDIYMFPRLSSFSSQNTKGTFVEDVITSTEQLLMRKHTLIQGEELSGKTALGRHLFLHLTSRHEPVIHLDLKELTGRSRDVNIKHAFYQEFSGDYDIWVNQKSKTLILDNLTSDGRAINFLQSCQEIFDRIVVMAGSDTFASFFKDDIRLVNFGVFEIQPLSQVNQEELIRKRMRLSQPEYAITDGNIDHIENRVNSIVISDKIVPRYPFFILSILQTYEDYMPENLSISSYGHCYHALIVAMLIKAGIEKSDSGLGVCFNFFEHLAYHIYQQENDDGSSQNTNFESFVSSYSKDYILPQAIFNRMRHQEYGIITADGEFRRSYMYYFFLGRFFAKASRQYRSHISKICEEGHKNQNHLILLFIIHHSDDDEIIDDIALRTMCTLENISPAVLDDEETGRFLKVLTMIPKDILSDKSVEKERSQERQLRDKAADRVDEEFGDNSDSSLGSNAGEMYRVLKSNKVLGQILRNKYGSLPKSKIEEIVETIADGGLRLVNSVLANDEEIRKWANNLNRKNPNYEMEKLENALRLLSFMWTLSNIESIVDAINVPDIRQTVKNVVLQKSTPAYDIIGYFSQLDGSEALSEETKKQLDVLLKQHRNQFVKSVLSLRTQRYINTHKSKTPIEQSVCSTLGIPYRYKRS